MPVHARFILSALLVSLLAVAVFALALPGGFLLDDDFNILRHRILYIDVFDINEFIYAALSFHDGNGSRALPMLSFAVDYWRGGGMLVANFKITNLVIHGLTVAVVFGFLLRLFTLMKWQPQAALKVAAFLAFIWAIHPLQVSSVFYVVQRMQTMVTLFIVAALWAYLAMRQAHLAGGTGRKQGILVLLFWALALMCKEDAVLFPAYTFILELTILHFAAAQPKRSRGLKQSYALMIGGAVLLYAFYVLPHYWQWVSYGSRNFSSYERLLTQARVLTMYIGQIAIPWPNNMPFNYDGYQISRGLLAPATTLLSLLFIVATLVWAWLWRAKRPLFAFGVLFFFAGHFITSNVIGLELVFEHRNHLPLLGVVLALFDLACVLSRYLTLSKRTNTALAAVVLAVVLMGGATRAYTWGDPARLGEKLVELTPNSARSWTEWSNAYFKQYIQTEDVAYLQHALAITEQSFEHVDSAILAANFILCKSMLGTLVAEDWLRWQASLNKANKTQRRHSFQMLMMNAENGHLKDLNNFTDILVWEVEEHSPDFRDTLRIGMFMFKHDFQEKAFLVFKQLALRSEANNPKFISLLEGLEKQGYQQWVTELKAISK